MNQRRILMVVPYKARDLEGHALVGYHLVRQFGHEVIYTNGYGIETKMLKHAPDVLVLDHLSWNFKVEQARLAKSLGMQAVILPTEGLFQNEEGAVRRAGKLHNANHLPDKYLTWGEYPRRALLDEKLMTETQVETVGCARFDFYHEPYLNLMSSRADFVRQLGLANEDAPIVLWATNTAYSSRNASKMLERQIKKAKKPMAEVQDHISDHKIQFREHSALVEELARRNPQWNFVIKVHPAEWINPYLELSKRLTNIKVAFDAPIREFLFHADVLLQRNCTSATEAWMFGKPVINLEVGEYRRPVREEYASGNHLVYNVDEAEDAVNSYLSGRLISEEQQAAREAFIEEFYFKVDGLSAERTAKSINDVIRPDAYSDEMSSLKDKAARERLERKMANDDSKLANRLKDMIGIERGRSLRLWKGMVRREVKDNAGVFVAEPEITQEMVDELYNRFDSLKLDMERTGEKATRTETRIVATQPV